MKLVLKKTICIKNIKDFEIDPSHSTIITIGSKISFFNSTFLEEKKLEKKIYSGNYIKHIKEDNQIFASTTFYIQNSKNQIIKCDSSTKKKVACVFENPCNIENIGITKMGRIIYIYLNTLYSFDPSNNKLHKLELDGSIEDSNTMYISNENIILKKRKIYTDNNQIKIYKAYDLTEISDISTQNNNSFIKLIGIRLICAKNDGIIEIWDASTNEMLDYKQIYDKKISYIENDDEWFYFGTSTGDIIVTNDKFDVINKISLFKSEINKILYHNDMLYVISNDKIAVLNVIDDDDEKVISNFINSYDIHEEYKDFFTTDIVTAITNFIEKETQYTPIKKNIFKALQYPISNLKICILGQDPYPQPNVATGLAFEVESKSWNDKSINASLKNIVKLIYSSYTGNSKEINEIRAEINEGLFKILPPDKLFKSWTNQGVLLLNTALTTELGNPKSSKHINFWKPIIKDLIRYITLKNTNITFLLWGNEAILYEKYIINGNVIKHNHPAIPTKSEKTFLNGKSFIETKNIINWLGGNNNE